MQAHENDHDQHGGREEQGGNHQNRQQNEEESHELGGDEPAPRAAAAAAEAGGPPAAQATEQRARVADSRGRSLGNFLITHYTFALESDARHNGSPKVSAPGLPADKKYKRSFLGSPYGIRMQGTGLADDGQYIRYVGNGRYAYGVGGAAGTPEAWKTVAVDPRVIPLRSQLEIEIYRSRGTFTAKDTGGAIRNNHIDVFAGAIPISEAYALGTKHSEVTLLDGSGGGGGGRRNNGGGGGGGGDHDEQHGDGQQGNGQQGNGQQGGGDQYRAAPSLADVRAGRGVIERGMQGASVTFVQEKVNATADGKFGPRTETAVKQYQRAHHLTADGEVGPRTMAAMDGHAQGQGQGQGQGQHGTGGASGGGGSGGGGGTREGQGQGQGQQGQGQGQGQQGQGDGQRENQGGDEAQIRDEVISKARTHLNAPYSWGAQGPSMFDCSGFAWYVLHTDTHLTERGRTNASGLSGSAYTTSIGEPEKGDLVFYASGGNINHVTIALGSGSQTIGASGGGSRTHGDNPNAKVKVTDWSRDRRSKSFGSIKRLIERKLQGRR